MTNQEKAKLLTKANEYIKKCNAVPVVHAFDGGVLELNSLLVDFVKYINYEDGELAISIYTDENRVFPSKNDIEKFNKRINEKYSNNLK